MRYPVKYVATGNGAIHTPPMSFILPAKAYDAQDRIIQYTQDAFGIRSGYTQPAYDFKSKNVQDTIVTLTQGDEHGWAQGHVPHYGWWGVRVCSHVTLGPKVTAATRKYTVRLLLHSGPRNAQIYRQNAHTHTIVQQSTFRRPWDTRRRALRCDAISRTGSVGRCVMLQRAFGTRQFRGYLSSEFHGH